MSRGDGSKFVAAVRLGFGVAALGLLTAFVWQLSADHAQSTLDARHYAEENAARARDRAQRACGRAEPAAVYECVAKQVAATREDQRSEYDLSAQQQMADWAFWMMLASIITMGVTTWALWYVKGTLDATRAAAGEANKATLEMVRSNEISQAAQRPWIKITPRIRDFYCDGKVFGFTFIVTFKNIGRSVADSFHPMLHVFFTGEDFLTVAMPIAQEAYLKQVGPFSRILMPGDEDYAILKNNYVIADLPWFGSPERVHCMVLALAHYREGKRRPPFHPYLDQKLTLDTFHVGNAAHDVVRQMWLFKDDLAHLKHGDFGFKKTIPNSAR